MKTLTMKSKPKAGAAKRGRPARKTYQPPPRKKAMNETEKVEEQKPKEPEFEEQEEEDEDEKEDEEDEDMSEQEKGNGGGGGDEKELVLGHKTEATVETHLYPREEVRKILLDEVDAQEKYEDEDYDRRAKAQEEAGKKAQEAMDTMKYDPDKLRDDAKQANEATSDPNKAKQQAKAIQELRAKLYPQPSFGKGGGGGQ